MDCNWSVIIGIVASVVTILVPIFTFLGFLYREIRSYRLETKAEIVEMKKGFQEEIRIQSQRSDQLYQMFIDLLKNQNPKTNP